ncbi:hypothetical protein ACWEIJ_22865 [Lentzea sp. NPDC004789]
MVPLTEEEIIRLGGCVYDMHGVGLPIWATRLITPPAPLGSAPAIYSAQFEQHAVTVPSTAVVDAVWELVGQWKRLTASVDLLQSLGERLTDDDYLHAAQVAGIAEGPAFTKIAAGADRGIAAALRGHLTGIGSAFASTLDDYTRTMQSVLAWQRTGEPLDRMPWEGPATYGGSVGGCVVGAGMFVAGTGILATTVVAVVASDGAALPLAPMATTLGTGLFAGGAAVMASECF